jgi:uncharacterized membrane protein YeaQ/YmgE (transglycosylase-associated protein family)
MFANHCIFKPRLASATAVRLTIGAWTHNGFVPRCLNGEQQMAIESLLIWLVIGAIAGWLAGQIMKGSGFGLVGDIVIGIVGAVVGGWLLPRIGVFVLGGMMGEILRAVIGACVVLFLVRLFK